MGLNLQLMSAGKDVFYTFRSRNIFLSLKKLHLLDIFKLCDGCTHMGGQGHHGGTLSTALYSPGFSHPAL